MFGHDDEYTEIRKYGKLQIQNCINKVMQLAWMPRWIHRQIAAYREIDESVHVRRRAEAQFEIYINTSGGVQIHRCTNTEVPRRIHTNMHHYIFRQSELQRDCHKHLHTFLHTHEHAPASTQNYSPNEIGFGSNCCHHLRREGKSGKVGEEGPTRRPAEPCPPGSRICSPISPPKS
jgi:hypothetical protein